MKLNGVLKLDTILSQFLIDYSMYKGKYDDALLRVQEDVNSLAKDIRAVSLLYGRKLYSVSL